MKDGNLVINTKLAETSSKMVSKLCQKWLTAFRKKAQILCCSDHQKMIWFKFCQLMENMVKKANSIFGLLMLAIAIET